MPDGQSVNFYADDSCMQPVITDACTYLVDTVSVLPRDACSVSEPPLGARILAKGNTPISPSTLLYLKDPTCRQFTVASMQGVLFAATEVAPTSFVEATVAVEP